MPIDYEACADELRRRFAAVEHIHAAGTELAADERWVAAADRLFASRTQAYREVLLGCVIARLHDSGVDIRLPYVSHGPEAFNGRTLDERVVNPFLRHNKIPCSAGPYLSVFRRSVRFDAETVSGLRDKPGYEAFLGLLQRVEQARGKTLGALYDYLLYRFVLLREATVIPLLALNRISLEQCSALMGALTETPSGGRFPVLVVLSALKALAQRFNLDWVIESQGINVADKASGAIGDITVTRQGMVLFAIEITERPLDRERVVQTFDMKIAPTGVSDYLFITRRTEDVGEAAMAQARKYFAQGHEINFLNVRDWIVGLLALSGQRGRTLFIENMVGLLDTPEIPASLKTAWNQCISSISA